MLYLYTEISTFYTHTDLDACRKCGIYSLKLMTNCKLFRADGQIENTCNHFIAFPLLSYQYFNVATIGLGELLPDTDLHLKRLAIELNDLLECAAFYVLYNEYGKPIPI